MSDYATNLRITVNLQAIASQAKAAQRRIEGSGSGNHHILNHLAAIRCCVEAIERSLQCPSPRTE